MTSNQEGVLKESGKSRGPQCGPGSFLILYETGILALAAALTIGLAAGGDDRLARSTPFLLTVLGIWGLFDLLGTLFFARSGRRTSVRLIGDLTFCLCLVGWTGGVESFLIPILLACVALASSQLGLRRALFLSTGASLVLVFITVGRIKGWTVTELLGVDSEPSGFGWQTAVQLFGQVIALVAVALLGSRLGGGLRYAERINDLIVGAIAEGIVIVDRYGRIRHVNSIARGMLGFPGAADWRGRSVSDVLRRSEDGQLRTELENPRVGERRVEYRVDRDERVPLRLRTTVAESDMNGARTWIFLMRDLTLEHRVSRAEERLEHLEELEDLALGLAHEIRNPLASIRGGVQELASGRLDEAQSERLARVILRESDRLDRTVSQFMEYSRTKAQETTEPISLAACLEEVREVLVERIDARDIEISLEIEDGLDDSMEGSRDLIHKVFLNLGINAIEAGTRSLMYRMGAGRTSGIQVVVADEGQGMDEETRTRAFNPFFTTKTREGGLGLALVRKIVDGHRGTIEIESEKGTGTRMCVWFPSEAMSENTRPLESLGAQQ